MSQTRPRGNFTQTLLTFAVIFLGFMVLRNGFSTPPDPRTSDQLLAKMREMNGLVWDHSIIPIHQLFVKKVEEEAAAGKMTAEAASQRKLEGDLLVVSTQYRGGLLKADIQRMVPAYDTLRSLKRQYGDKPVWKTPFTLAASPTYSQFSDTSATFESLLAQVDEASRRLGKETPVWGFFPGYQLVDFLVNMTGAVPAFSYAFAALILALCVRAVVFPIAQRQMMFGRQMAQLSPLISEIREQYKKKGDTLSPQDTQEMNARIMGLYKEYGLNPMAGCLPAFAQMPLFLLIYTSMLHYRFEFQKGVFLWINPATAASSNGFLAANLGEKDYILIVLYGISFVITTLLTPVSDPANAKQQRMMGIGMSLLFSVMMFFWPVPSAFVLYWIFTNIFATAQSLRAYRLPLPPLVKVNAPNGGVFPGAINNGSLNGKSSGTGVPKRHKPKKRK